MPPIECVLKAGKDNFKLISINENCEGCHCQKLGKLRFVFIKPKGTNSLIPIIALKLKASRFKKQISISPVADNGSLRSSHLLKST
jgi:hypothetical protein